MADCENQSCGLCALVLVSSGRARRPQRRRTVGQGSIQDLGIGKRGAYGTRMSDDDHNQPTPIHLLWEAWVVGAILVVSIAYGIKALVGIQ